MSTSPEAGALALLHLNRDASPGPSVRHGPSCLWCRGGCGRRACSRWPPRLCLHLLTLGCGGSCRTTPGSLVVTVVIQEGRVSGLGLQGHSHPHNSYRVPPSLSPSVCPRRTAPRLVPLLPRKFSLLSWKPLPGGIQVLLCSVSSHLSNSPVRPTNCYVPLLHGWGSGR